MPSGKGGAMAKKADQLALPAGEAVVAPQDHLTAPMPNIAPPSPSVLTSTTEEPKPPLDIRSPSGDELRRFSTLTQEIFVPVHGFVEFSEPEITVLNHPALQRLGEIYQLGQAHLVFRGATHKRLEHCLGTVAAAEFMMEAVKKNFDRAAGRRGESLAPPFTITERAFVRLGALTHDIGHLPAGHTLEDELGLLDKHDYGARLALVLDRSRWAGIEQESLRTLIDREYAALVPDCPFAASELLLQVISKNPTKEEPFGSRGRHANDPIRLTLCQDVVGNTICADLLDYLHRDWWHVGKPKHFDRRLLQYMEVRTGSGRTDGGKDDVFVVSMGQRPKVRPDAVSAILDLLESRYELAETVLFHRTKLAFSSMLERGIQEIREVRSAQWHENLAEALLDLPDLGMLDFFIREAKNVPAARLPLERLRQRRVYEGLFTRFSEEYPADVVTRLIALYAVPKTSGDRVEEEKTRAREAAARRLRALRILEDDFRLPPGSLAMYCPASMNAKIAKVKVSVDGQISSFDAWEDHPNRLSGGHLAAQQNRFKRLWRVHVFIDSEVLAGMSTAAKRLLKSTVKELVFPKNVDPEGLDEAAFDLATRASQIPDLPLFGAVIEEPAFAARSDSSFIAQTYPTDAPSLMAFRRS
jgi:HD superfamily phosphohydrolase